MMEIEKMRERWIALNSRKGNRIILVILGAILSMVYIPIIDIEPVYILLFASIAIVLLIISVIYYYHIYSLYILLGSFVCYALLNIIIFLILSVILNIFVLLFLYRFFNKRRVARIRKYAKMTPAQILGGLSRDKDKPEVTIFIRGKK